MLQTSVCRSRRYTCRVTERRGMESATRNLALAAVGGTLWAVVPALDGTVPWIWSVAPVAPVLLSFGVLECWRRYHATWGRAGRAGAALAGLGLALLTVAALLRQALAGIVAAFVVAPTAVAGFLALWAGSTFLAVVLRRAGVLGTVGAVAFAAALPVSVPANVVFGPAALGLGPSVVPAGFGVYGLAWAGLAIRLFRASRATPPEIASGPGDATVLDSPQRVVACVVALAVGALGVLGVVPLGGPFDPPFAGETATLDATHALLGVTGVLAAVVGERYARSYNRLAGVAFLALAALPFLPGPAGVGLAFVDLVVYLPAAALTLGTGFAASDGAGSRSEPSSADEDVRDGGEEADGEDRGADRGR